MFLCHIAITFGLRAAKVQKNLKTSKYFQDKMQNLRI